MTPAASDVRRRLDHPVIDADGHFMEFMPLVEDGILEHLYEVGGAELRDHFRNRSLRTLDTAVFEANRSNPDVTGRWKAMPSWWGNPVADPRERATSHLPRLMYERLDELGVDVMLAYPSWTLGYLMESDPSLRAPACRAVNRYTAELFEPYGDRLRPAAIIPMETPQEAVAEIDYAVAELRFSLVLLAGYAMRSTETGSRLDVYGIDSAADYDRVWESCVRHRVAPVFHSSLQSVHPARSISNYAFNHIGGLAHAHEALCKALFIGGVYRRFPDLRFGYLEGGVMWGASLLADLVGHWEKRGGRAIEDLDPSLLDVDAVMSLVAEYGTADMIANAGRIESSLRRPPARPEQLDEFAATGIGTVDEMLAVFAGRSFFGCEADDPLMPLALDLRIAHRPVTLRPMLGTDVGHWDAPVMNRVIPEAYEAVEEGRIDEAGFRSFVFANAVALHGGVNPSFFEGTMCEKEAEAELGAT